MTEAELKAIEERAEKATPGPWISEGSQIARRVSSKISVNDHMIVRDGGMWSENEKFIAHARTDIPALLAHIRAVEAERDAMRFTAESLLAAFDTRPDGEPDWITQSTREAALNCARQDLGWPTRQGLQSAPPSYNNAIQFLQSLRDVSPEEAEEQRKTWEVLQQALNEGRND